MKDRLELHAKLVEVLGSDNVYFQPPASSLLKYPCIIYSIANIKPVNADNGHYKQNRSFTLTLIHKHIENEVTAKLEDLPQCTFDRWYAADNMHHFVYSIWL